ncbi:MAG: hypothetical protein R2844_08235 [Caldilineales bacterium]
MSARLLAMGIAIVIPGLVFAYAVLIYLYQYTVPPAAMPRWVNGSACYFTCRSSTPSSGQPPACGVGG